MEKIKTNIKNRKENRLHNKISKLKNYFPSMLKLSLEVALKNSLFTNKKWVFRAQKCSEIKRIPHKNFFKKFSVLAISLSLFFVAAMMVSAGDLRFRDGVLNVSDNMSVDTNTLFVDSTNNRVGIGTTNPGMKLVVVGNANVSQNLTVNNSVLFVDGTSGRVGIGTTSPQRNLHVFASSAGTHPGWSGDDLLVLERNGNAVLGFFSPSTTVQGLVFSDPEDRDVGAVVYSHSADSMSFRVSDATRMVINNLGNVGIGTTSPATTLDVKGKANFTGNFSIGQTSNIFFVDNTSGRVGIGTTSLDIAGTVLDTVVVGWANPSVQYGVIVDKREAGGARLGFANEGTYAAGMIFQSDERLDIDTGGTNARITILEGGNVGIGTTSPAQTLTVQGRVNISQNLTVNNSVLFVDGTSGRVGIGTTAPQTLLSITKGTNQDADLLGFVDGGTSLFQFYGRFSGTGTTGNWLTLTDWGDHNIMTWRGDGNVGIGTASPNATLTVASGKTTIADEWTVRSDRDIKTNIVNYEHTNILDNLLTVYRYKYKYQEPVYDADGEMTGFEDKISREHIGIMADEAPAELLGANGKSIDLYAFVSYVYAYAQEVKRENDALKARIETLEKQ